MCREVLNITKKEEHEKLERALKNKQDQVEAERKKKYFYMHKWDLIRSKKQEMLEEKIEERECRRRLKMYITMMEVLKMSHKLLSNYLLKKALNQQVLNKTI